MCLGSVWVETCRAKGGEREGEGKGERTVFVVDRDGVRGPVAVLVLRDHHGDGERLETIARQRDADVSTASTTSDGRGRRRKGTHGGRSGNEDGDVKVR
jgi:hypothetical protein